MATAPRKPRSVRAVNDAGGDIDLNLDTYEREGGPTKPFSAVVNGRKITMHDPQNVPWQKLVDLDNPDDFAELVIAEEDREAFLDEPLEAWKMNLLMERFRQHYGLGDPGNAGA